MDISGDLSATMNAASQSGSTSVAMLRKTLDIQQQTASQLIELAASDSVQAARPSAGSVDSEQLGRHLDVSA